MPECNTDLDRRETRIRPTGLSVRDGFRSGALQRGWLAEALEWIGAGASVCCYTATRTHNRPLSDRAGGEASACGHR